MTPSTNPRHLSTRLAAIRKFVFSTVAETTRDYFSPVKELFSKPAQRPVHVPLTASELQDRANLEQFTQTIDTLETDLNCVTLPAYQSHLNTAIFRLSPDHSVSVSQENPASDYHLRAHYYSERDWKIWRNNNGAIVNTAKAKDSLGLLKALTVAQSVAQQEMKEKVIRQSLSTAAEQAKTEAAEKQRLAEQSPASF